MTEMRTETRHSGESLRFIVTGGHWQGLLEARLAPHFSALIYHLPGCNGESCGKECDAEMTEGDELLAAYLIDGDDAVWRELQKFASTVDDPEEKDRP
jgi:hypothetical protein